MESAVLKNLQYLYIKDGENIYFGAHQEWYEKMWQKRAGCGPTTATMLISYYQSKKNDSTDVTKDKAEFLELMKEIWDYVTPGYRGVNSTSIFVRGCHEYAKKHEIEYEISYLNVMPDKKLRPTTEEIADFILTALADDNPVAFLNLHNGEEKNLDRWHWVLLVSFDSKTGTALMYDQGVSKYINIYLWLKTTLFGGGFVTIS